MTKIAAPILTALGYELVEVEFVKEGSNWYLRIYIDKDDTITLDDCQLASGKLSEELDKLDPIKQSYFFEVSSPGIDRPLVKDNDFKKYAGRLVELKMAENPDVQSSGIIEGELIGLNDDGFIIIKTDKGNEIKIDRAKTAYIKRQIKF